MKTSPHDVCEMACEILHPTHDGDLLEPHLLALLEGAVNGWLPPEREHLFLILHDTVKRGDYIRPWFHGIEHLFRDHVGYVYWKGKQIEHYSFTNWEREDKAAHKLADCCRLMESRGLEINLTNYFAILDELEKTP